MQHEPFGTSGRVPRWAAAPVPGLGACVPGAAAAPAPGSEAVVPGAVVVVPGPAAVCRGSVAGVPGRASSGRAAVDGVRGPGVPGPVAGVPGPGLPAAVDGVSGPVAGVSGPVPGVARMPASAANGGALLEVIVLDAADARAAEAGGADRVELVSDMARDGLSPALATFEAVRAAVAVPVRVMLRTAVHFAAGDLDAVCDRARAFRAAGADEFVLGFLDRQGAVDVPAVEAVLAVVPGCRWTFHRAIDAAADRAAAWRALDGLPGLDSVLTAGSRAGVGEGLRVLAAEAANRGSHVLAGGGLRAAHVGPLRAAGVSAFHSGSAVRSGGRWDRPVDPALVAGLRRLVG